MVERSKGIFKTNVGEKKDNKKNTQFFNLQKENKNFK